MENINLSFQTWNTKFGILYFLKLPCFTLDPQSLLTLLLHICSSDLHLLISSILKSLQLLKLLSSSVSSTFLGSR